METDRHPTHDWDSTLVISKSTLRQALTNLRGRRSSISIWPTADEVFQECMDLENERVHREKCLVCGDPVVENSPYCMRHELI